jgi:hypothetical protein
MFLFTIFSEVEAKLLGLLPPQRVSRILIPTADFLFTVVQSSNKATVPSQHLVLKQMMALHAFLLMLDISPNCTAISFNAEIQLMRSYQVHRAAYWCKKDQPVFVMSFWNCAAVA